MKKLLSTILLVAMMSLGTTLFAQGNGDKLLGLYRVESPFSDDVAKVLVTKATNGTYTGRITWVNKPTNPDGTPRTDEKNSDPKLRNRKPEEIIMFWNIKYEGDEWVDGTLYDPYSGKKFSVKFKLAKNGSDVQARYYKGIPAVGINATWKRLK